MQLLRKILFPFSLVYALVVYARNFLYDRGFFKSVEFSSPTLCVGNLSVGGTGKTPMVEFLIALMHNEYKIAILSRGYKRKSKGFVLADTHTSVEDLGDEPFQISKKFPDVSVAVDANRKNGITLLEEKIAPELIILDDAFQHRRVKPTFSILLTAYGDLYSKDWYLPTGNLRDAKKEAKRANIIVVTKCPKSLEIKERESIIKIIAPQPHQKVLFSTLSYDDFLRSDTGALSFSALDSKKISLVTGIANPQPLVDHLTALGVSFEHFRFGDHHYFTDKEITSFSKNDIILTTEKDFSRLNGKVENLYALGVAHEFLDDGDTILKEAISVAIKLGFRPSS